MGMSDSSLMTGRAVAAGKAAEAAGGIVGDDSGPPLSPLGRGPVLGTSSESGDTPAAVVLRRIITVRVGRRW